MKRRFIVAALTAPLLAAATEATRRLQPLAVAGLRRLVRAANGMSARMAADQQTIQPPTSVTQLSCLEQLLQPTPD